MMKRILILLFAPILAVGQFSFPKDPHLQKLKGEAKQCFERREMDCAKRKYSLVLKDNKTDAEAIQKIKEIEKYEEQKAQQKIEKQKAERSRVTSASKISSGYGKLIGLYDENYEKFDYEGQVKNNIPDGKGKADYFPYCNTCGQEYGTWINGKREGAFTAYYPSKSRYEANYRNNLLEGQFIFYDNTSGTTYHYNYINGKKKGIQSINYKDGSSVVVNTINDDIEGNATYYAKDGAKITGYYKNGDMIKISLIEGPDGFSMICNIYLGQTEATQTSITWPNKMSFLGTVLPKETGNIFKGILFEGDGIDTQAEFNFDERGITILDGKVKSSYNGMTFEGDYKNGSRNGKGLLKFKDGTQYLGDFKDGKMTGFGVMTVPEDTFFTGLPSCNQYEGAFVDDKMHGFGKCYTRFYNTRTKMYSFILLYEGQFKNDKPTGKYPQKKKKR